MFGDAAVGACGEAEGTGPECGPASVALGNMLVGAVDIQEPPELELSLGAVIQVGFEEEPGVAEAVVGGGANALVGARAVATPPGLASPGAALIIPSSVGSAVLVSAR